MKILITDLAQYAPQNIPKEYWLGIDTKKAILAKEPCLFDFSAALGSEAVISFIASWLEQANDMINVKRGLNPTSIEIISIEILKDYGHFKISEFIFLVLTITKAENGSFFQSFSSEQVFSVFRNHKEKRKRFLQELIPQPKTKSLNMTDRMMFVVKNLDKLPALQNLNR